MESINIVFDDQDSYKFDEPQDAYLDDVNSEVESETDSDIELRTHEDNQYENNPAVDTQHVSNTPLVTGNPLDWVKKRLDSPKSLEIQKLWLEPMRN